MKCDIKYNQSFIIPKNLPHAYREDDETGIFQDEVRPALHPYEERVLLLSSKCGVTAFPENYWKDNGDHYDISPCIAKFDGAYHALNSICGIDFPEWEISNIESSLGRFQTELYYKISRATFKALGEARNNGHTGQALIDHIRVAISEVVHNGRSY